MHVRDTVVIFRTKVGQIGTKWDTSGTFSDQISVHLAPGRQMHWNVIWKSPGCVPFGANLTHFGAKPTILDSDLYLCVLAGEEISQDALVTSHWTNGGKMRLNGVRVRQIWGIYIIILVHLSEPKLCSLSYIPFGGNLTHFKPKTYRSDLKSSFTL